MIPISVRFRRTHLKQLLQRFDLSKGPLDLFVSLYFRHNPQLGSKDRAYISDRVYRYYRLKGLIDALAGKKGLSFGDENYWDFAIELIDEESGKTLKEAQNDETITIWDRLSVSENLYHAIYRTWAEKTPDLCLSFNKEAPLTIRVNTLKVSPEKLLQSLKEKEFEVSQDQEIETAIHFKSRVALFSLPEFKEGFFEIQDKGSQLIAQLVTAGPKDHILDYCAGAGGKTLAIAPRLQGSGQIYLHDIRNEALLEAKKRLKRAGVQNVQLIHHEESKRLSRLKGKMDWVFVDAPCSGTGTLRRNPDMKWKFSHEMVERLHLEQKKILKEAISFMKPTGRLIWATCSLLKEENEDMVAFAQELGLELENPPLKTSPLDGGCDGFFAAVLRKRSELKK